MTKSLLEELLDKNQLSPEGDVVMSGHCAGMRKNGELFVCQRRQEMLQVCSTL